MNLFLTYFHFLKQSFSIIGIGLSVKTRVDDPKSAIRPFFTYFGSSICNKQLQVRIRIAYFVWLLYHFKKFSYKIWHKKIVFLLFIFTVAFFVWIFCKNPTQKLGRFATLVVFFLLHPVLATVFLQKYF